MRVETVRFFGDKEVRSIWDDKTSKWWFSVLDVIGVLREVDDYEKNRNYWKYLKAKLKGDELLPYNMIIQLKLLAPDGKKRLSDVIDYKGIRKLVEVFPNKNAFRLIKWLTYNDDSIDGKSKLKAYTLFNSSLLAEIEIGTTKGLQQIHGYLFGGLYDFAGRIRTKNISKGGFAFALANFLPSTLKNIEEMPDDTFEEIIEKYTEMNVAHPFMEGNGRSMRIWFDLMLKQKLGVCVDWSKVGKNEYMEAMKKSVVDSTQIRELLRPALTTKINDRDMFIRGIDNSYYYEQVDDIDFELD